MLLARGCWGGRCSRDEVALFAILAPRSVPLAVSLNLSAVSVGAAVAALIGGQVIDRVNAGESVPLRQSARCWALALSGERPRRYCAASAETV